MNLSLGDRFCLDHRTVHAFNAFLSCGLRAILLLARRLQLHTCRFVIFLLVELALVLVSDSFASDTSEPRGLEPADGEFPLFLQLFLELTVLRCSD